MSEDIDSRAVNVQEVLESVGEVVLQAQLKS